MNNGSNHSSKNEPSDYVPEDDLYLWNDEDCEPVHLWHELSWVERIVLLVIMSFSAIGFFLVMNWLLNMIY